MRNSVYRATKSKKRCAFKVCFLLFCCLMLSLAAPPRSQAQGGASLFQVVNLGIPPGAVSSVATALNDQRQVVVNASFSTTDFSLDRCFVWENGVLTDVGTLGGTFCRGHSINNLGHVVGESTLSNGDTHAFIWDQQNGIRDLGTLGGRFSRAVAINDRGEVTGSSTPAGVNPGTLAFIWDATNGMRALPTLPNGVNHTGESINNNGDVVGEAPVREGQTQVFHAFIVRGGAIQDLGFPRDAFVFDINDSAQVVGVFADVNRQVHPFLWQNGVAQELGFFADSINNKGQIVGDGFFVDGGVVQRLRDLIPANAGLTLTSFKQSINENGDIAGAGTFQGVSGSRGVLLLNQARKLTFTAQPGNAKVNQPLPAAVQVSVLDINGNVDTSANDTITLLMGNNPGGGTLSGTLIANAVNGVATFNNLSIDKAGRGYTIMATAANATDVASNRFNVGRGLVFTTQPSDVGVNQAIAPPVQVSVVDENDNRDASASDAVTVAIGNNAGGGTLSGTKTVNAVNGVATFNNLSLNKRGVGYTLVATSPSPDIAGATSNPFVIGPRLKFSVHPTSTGVDTIIAPAVQVQVLDENGNVDMSAIDTITVDIGNNPSGASLSGTQTKAAEGGVATFDNLSVDKPGKDYTLVATSATLGTVSATSNPFTIGRRLAFKDPLGTIPLNDPIAELKVEVQNPDGSPDTTATDDVTLSFGANPGGATLSGMTTVTAPAVNGVATFNDLRIDKLGRGYTLKATAPGVADATSNPFDVRGFFLELLAPPPYLVDEEVVFQGGDWDPNGGPIRVFLNDDPNAELLVEFVQVGGSSFDFGDKVKVKFPNKSLSVALRAKQGRIERRVNLRGEGGAVAEFARGNVTDHRTGRLIETGDVLAKVKTEGVLRNPETGVPLLNCPLGSPPVAAVPPVSDLPFVVVGANSAVVLRALFDYAFRLVVGDSGKPACQIKPSARTIYAIIDKQANMDISGIIDAPNIRVRLADGFHTFRGSGLPFPQDAFDTVPQAESTQPLPEVLPSSTLQALNFRDGDLRVDGDLRLRNATVAVRGNLTVTGSIAGRGAILVQGQIIVRGSVNMQTDEFHTLVATGDISIGANLPQLTNPTVDPSRLTVRGGVVAFEVNVKSDSDVTSVKARITKPGGNPGVLDMTLDEGTVRDGRWFAEFRVPPNIRQRPQTFRVIYVARNADGFEGQSSEVIFKIDGTQKEAKSGKGNKGGGRRQVVLNSSKGSGLKVQGSAKKSSRVQEFKSSGNGSQTIAQNPKLKSQIPNPKSQIPKTSSLIPDARVRPHPSSLPTLSGEDWTAVIDPPNDLLMLTLRTAGKDFAPDDAGANRVILLTPTEYATRNTQYIMFVGKDTQEVWAWDEPTGTFSDVTDWVWWDEDGQQMMVVLPWSSVGYVTEFGVREIREPMNQ
jgi:probable HAF family extracellular repeat protein